MSIFIHTPRGLVNLNRIEMAEAKKNGRHSIIVDGVEIDDNHPTFSDTIVSVIPVQGEWECLSPCEGEEGRADTVSVDPVIGWGLNCRGTLRPITATEMDGVEGNYALRRRGETRVYGYGLLGGYASPEEWLASLNPS